MINYIALSLLMAANTQSASNEIKDTNIEKPQLLEKTTASKQSIPRGIPDKWITLRDYPSQAGRQGLEGTTSYRLTISPAGRVRSCIITKSSGHSILDEQTCKLIARRARFYPAKDESGKSTFGTYSNKAVWTIPK